jgi:hypothetical protein
VREEALQLSSYSRQPSVGRVEFHLMDVIIPCVLLGLCLCIFASGYILLSYAVYVIMWKNKELGA